jgi:hypothetical protein
MSMLRSLANRQFGLVSRSQALAAGLSQRAIGRRLQSSQWERLYPSVYRLPGAPRSWEQKLMGALLWAGPEAALSHRSAAALWKLDGVAPGALDVLVAGSRSNSPPGLMCIEPVPWAVPRPAC